MPHPILGASNPSPGIHQKIGEVAVEWAWVEMILAELIANFCSSDPGAMYVLTKNTASSTITGWLRTLVEIKIKDAASAKVISDLLTEVDDTRQIRNVIIHGNWRGSDDPTTAIVQTFNWDRAEVVKDELWSAADLTDFVDEIMVLQHKLCDLGIKMGLMKTNKA